MSAHGSVIPPASSGERIRGTLFRGALLGSLLISVLVLGVLIYDTALKGLDSISLGFLTNPDSIVTPEAAGLGPALMGTLMLMAICAVFIVPVGVATAIYLEEYADSTRWYNRAIELNIQNLAGVPSVVYGILGLAFFADAGLALGPVLLAGGLTLALLVLPVVIIAGREALRAVPPSIREGSLALGATQWQTIARQVLPAAVPGIATGVILALSRAIGETAPLIVIGAAGFITSNPDSLTSFFTALPIQIFTWFSSPNQELRELVPAGILVLLVLLLVINSIAIYFRNRFESKW